MAEKKAIVHLTINQGDAKRQIKELTSLIDNLKKKKNEATASGDTKLAAQLRREIKSTNTELVAQRKFAINVEQVLQNVNKVPMKDIYSALGLLRKEVVLADRDSEHYKKTLENINKLKAIADKHDKSAGNSSGGDKTFGWVKNLTYIGGATAVIDKLSGKAREAYDEFLKLGDAMAGVQRTTGLTKDEVITLNEQLARINTRTSQEELLGLAYVAGKLGITGTRDVLAFVEAADKIGVALGDDLGGKEQAINTMGKLVDLFKIKDEYGMAEGMLKVGSAINALGAASTANEGYIVDWTSRVGGISTVANISAANVMGFAATFDSLNAECESSATVVNKVITGMFKDTSQYAKVAKMDVKSFAGLLKTDANEALLRVMEGFKGQDLGVTASLLGEVGEKGARAVQSIALISDNISMVREQQAIANKEFEAGTSIGNEFNNMNTTAAAERDKQLKELSKIMAEVGEKIAPMFTAFLEGTVSATRVAGELVKILWDYRGAILAAAAAYGIAYAIQKKQIIQDAVYNTWQKLKTIWTAAEATAINGGTAAMAGYTLGQKALIAVKALLVGQFKAAGIAAKGFFASLGPAGWAVIAISAIVGTMALLGSKTKEAKGAYAELALKTKQESDTHLELRQRLTATSEGTAERAELIKLINERYREYLPALLTEKSSTEDIATALDLATVAMKNNIAQKIRQQELEKIQTSQYEAQKKILDELLERYNRNGDKNSTQMQNMANQLTPLIQGIDETSDKATTLMDILNKVYGWSGKSDIRMQRGFGTVNFIFDELVRSSTKFKMNLIAIDALAPEGVGKSVVTPDPDADKKCAKCGNNPCTCKKLPLHESRKESWSLANDENFGRAQIALKKRLMNGEIATEAEHNRLLLALEIKTLEDRLRLTSVKGEERNKLERELLDKQYTQNKAEQARIQKLQDIIDGGKDPAEQERIRYEKQLKELGLFGVARENMTKQDLEALLTVEKAHTTKLSALHFEALSKQFDASQKAMNKETTTLKTEQAAEVANLKTFKDKEAFLKSVYTEKEMQQITTNKKADQAIKAVFQQEEAKAQEEHLRQMLITYQSMMTEFAAWGTVSGEILTAEDVAKFEAIIAELEAKLANLGDNINLPPETGADGGVDILGMTADKWESMFKNLADGKVSIEEIGAAIGAIGGAMGAAFSDVSNLMSAIEQRDLKQFEKNQNKKKQALDRQLKAGTISQEAYNARVQQIDEETEAKRVDMERKQAERQKMLAVFSAIINTAVAITSAISQGGPIAGPILAGIVGALGAMQVAAILAQPLPGAEEGGLLVDRTQDGKRFNAEFEPRKRGRVDKPTVIVGENGAEYVVPSEGYDNPSVRSVLDIIEASRLNGTLRHIDLGSVIAASNIAGRAAGGYVSTPITAPQGPAPTQSSDTELHNTLDRVGDAVDRLVGKLDNIRAYVSHKELRKKDEQYNNIRKQL